jgi:hypothetical protein
LAAVLDGIQNQRKSLGEKFNSLSDEELLQMFTILRQSAYETDSQKIQILTAKIQEFNLGGSSSDLLPRLNRYVRTLNFLDYLPRQWFVESVGVAAEFDRLDKTRFLVYADIRGLGAKNLLQLHKQSDVLRQKTKAIGKLDAKLLQNLKTDRQDLLSERETMLQDLNELRTNILSSSNDRVNEVQAWLKATLNQSEVQSIHFAMWSGGDDLIAAVQSEKFGDARSFISTLRSSPEFPTDLRLAVVRLDQAAPMSLSDSRTAVAEIMHELKLRQARNDAIRFGWGSLNSKGEYDLEYGASPTLE